MTLRFPSLTTEYLRYPVEARRDGAELDPSVYPVSFAFTARGVAPVEADWRDGDWEADGDARYARILVGPAGGEELADGLYDVWLRVVDGPETPVRYVDALRVGAPVAVLDPDGGLCSPWVTVADIRAMPDAAGIPEGASVDEQLAECAASASGLLFALTARLFPGVCEDTVVPFPRAGEPAPAQWGRPASGNRLPAGGGGCGCGVRRAGCRCRGATHVGLGRFPVLNVLEVRLDGEVLADGWRLDEARWLVRLPDGDRRPRHWPCCPRDDLPPTEAGTFYVTFAWGAPVPAAGALAAKVLACHLALAQGLGSGECKLPARVVSYVRQGVQVSRMDPMSLLKDGKTGLWQIDLFLDTYNPTRALAATQVFVPGEAPEVTRPGTRG